MLASKAKVCLTNKEKEMNFGRDAKAILKDIKSKGMMLNSSYGDPLKYIESMVNTLRGNENVIDYIAYPKNLIDIFLLITDNGKILCSNVTETVTEGFIFDKSNFYYGANAFYLTELHEEETLIKDDEKSGFLRPSSDYLTLFFDTGTIQLHVKKKFTQELYKDILNQRKKFMPKPAPAKKSKAKDSAPKKESVPKQDGGAEAIKEIRKMYEDGIITKEEMMELLKAQLAK